MSSITINGDTSGSIILDAPAIAGSTTLTLPTTTGTLALTASPTFTGQATIPTINLTGGQITFPAIQNPSANANTLDDYEEGTWTPQLVFGGSSVGMVVVAARGSYTKVGRIVHVCFRFNYSTKGSSTGNANIAGLPFPAIGSVVDQGINLGIFSWESNGGTTCIVSPFALAWEDLTLYLRANNGAGASFSNITNANFGTTSEFWGSVVYRTAA